jgi:hypothetical protein
MPDQSPLHPVNRQHLDTLTDEVGIMQHAIGSRPDPAHGYCTDDVARALQVDVLHGSELGWPAVAGRARRSLDFLAEALDRGTGRFRNFRSVDGSWIRETGSQDCHGRAIHALGDVIAEAPDASLVTSATSLFDAALPAALGLDALRAQASVLLGCAARLRADPTSTTADGARSLAVQFLARFQEGSVWPWPESRLTYENALPARALIVAGQTFRSQPMIDTGLRVLDWLIKIQTTTDGHLSPIGNGWWKQGGPKSRFDQQPIEATALLLAAESAYQVTGYDRHQMAMERAYAWFLGKNDLGVDVADPKRGAGYDALTPHGANTNQGAESTLMWLIAVEHIRAARAQGASVGQRQAAARSSTAPRRTEAAHEPSIA